MRIQLKHHENFRFTATTEHGHTVAIDSSGPSGPATEASPMQLVASALGACSAIDVIDILTKGRHSVESFEIDVRGERASSPPRVFTSLHVHFGLTGDLTEDRVRRAVSLSLEKYCSVAKMLEKATPITASFSVNGQHYPCEIGVDVEEN